MAERKAVNKYYPPDWTPSKGSINTYNGSHPLRERARKLHEGILIIRFEMPYNIWCEGCNKHIGMGVRYNAQKSKTGMYYTTPIYKFRMKCHLCDNHFEMQTDPQNLDYVILNGARRQEQRWDPIDNQQVVPEDKTVTKKLATDPMFKLEHDVEDKQKSKSIEPAIEELEVFQSRWKDDYSYNRAIRKTFRIKKKELKAESDSDRGLLKKSSLPISMKLLPESKDDPKLAKLMKLEATQSFESKRRDEREKILKKSIFKIQPKIRPKTIKLMDKSKLFDSDKSFSIVGKTNCKKNKNIGIEFKNTNNKCMNFSNSLVDYNSSESE